MALTDVTGFTSDGLVWIRFIGTASKLSLPTKTTITMEPDQAESLGKRLLDAAEKALKARQRNIVDLRNEEAVVIPRR